MECHEMMQKLKDLAGCELCKSKEKIHVEELGEVIDMIKDLADAEEKEAEKKYYDSIVKAMKESEYETDYNINGRIGYLPGNRMDVGRPSMIMNPAYMPEVYNPMGIGNDMMRMGYDGMNSGSSMSSGGNQGTRRGMNNGMSRGGERRTTGGSRYGYSHDKYMEEREKYTSDSAQDKEKRKELLNEYLDDFMTSAKEMVEDMTPEEKQMWKVKLNRIVNM